MSSHRGDDNQQEVRINDTLMSYSQARKVAQLVTYANAVEAAQTATFYNDLTWFHAVTVAENTIPAAWMPTAMGRGAIGRGLRAPPRLTRRTEEEVARLVLQRMGGRAVDISASRLIDAATAFRIALPKTYHFFRRSW